MSTVNFQPLGRRGQCPPDQSLMECARQLGVDIVSLCGGIGSCDSCRVKVIAGDVSPPTPEEESALQPSELEQGYRLACQTYPLSDVRLYVPPESLTAPQRTQVEGLEVDLEPDPVVIGIESQLTRPAIESPLADAQNLWQALAEQGIREGKIDFDVQQALSALIRENEWQLRIALRGDEVVAVGSPFTHWLGLAVDMGTTKIAGYLLDLESGKTLASKGMMNPQISYGEDVISRIVAAGKSPANSAKLQSLLVEALNQLASDLCNETNSNVEQIVEAVVVGNTAIHHLFLGLPVKQLGLSPYMPAEEAAVDVKAREIGLNIAAGAYVHLLPVIAGYVGADHVALLLATRLADSDKTTLAIDIGTNTEICLKHEGKMTSVSCASGPAFEGAQIKFGMRAAPGAIEHMRLEGDKLEIQTIGGEAPAGICGSGLLDAVAQLRENDVIARDGKIVEHPRVQLRDGSPEFILAERVDLEPITISQKDVRELQLAKAAIRLGIQVLVDAAGLQENDIEKVIIAGAFGTYIDVKSAITIGMLPDLPLERFFQVGNAAGTGARLALISKSEREKAKQIAHQAGYIELARVPDFSRKFVEAIFL